jgi:hypothetical protein
MTRFHTVPAATAVFRPNTSSLQSAYTGNSQLPDRAPEETRLQLVVSDFLGPSPLSIPLDLIMRSIEGVSSLSLIYSRDLRGDRRLDLGVAWTSPTHTFSPQAVADYVSPVLSGIKLIDTLYPSPGGATLATPPVHLLAKGVICDVAMMTPPGRPESIRWPDRLRLPASDSIEFDIAAALETLERTHGAYALRLELSQFTLGLTERLVLGNLLKVSRPSIRDLHEDPVSGMQRVQTTQQILSWTTADSAFRLTCSLQLERASTLVAETVARSLFPMGGETSFEPTRDVELDLTLAWQSDQPMSCLTPTLLQLKALGFAQPCDVSRTRAAVDAPAVEIGHDPDGTPITIPQRDLDRHTLLLGATGTGKSTLLRQLIAQAASQDQPIVLIDPHGDLFDEAISHFGPETADILDFSGDGAPFSLDILQGDPSNPARHANFIANQMIDIFRKVLYRGVDEAFGPMFAAYFRNAILILMLSNTHDDRALWMCRTSLLDLDRVFFDRTFRSALLDRCADPLVNRFWSQIAVKAGGEASLENIAPYILSKLTALTGNPHLRSFLCPGRPEVDIGCSLAQKRSILVNLAKGQLGEIDAALAGAVVSTKLFAALMSRCGRTDRPRPPVRIFFDEFQTYATPALAQLLSEGRKTGAAVTLASQDLTSNGGSERRGDLAGTILSNVGNLIAFRLGPADARLLTDWYGSESLAACDFMGLADYTFLARLMKNGCPTTPSFGCIPNGGRR